MKENFGWVPGSDMLSTYVHLSGRDMEGALLKGQGITIGQEVKPKIPIKLTKYPRCAKDINSRDQFYPSRGMVLDEKTPIQLEEERTTADSLVDILMKEEKS